MDVDKSDADEAYHSGLTLGEDFKKDDTLEAKGPSAATAGCEGSGINPVSGTLHKERNAMNKLFSGKQAVSSLPKGGDSIKQSASTTAKSKLNLTGTPFAITPLAGRFQSISFQTSRSLTGEGGLSTDSPTSDYGSGNFPSLADSGFSSFPSMTSLEKPEKPGEGVAVTQTSGANLTTGKDSGQKMDVDSPAPKISIYSAEPAPMSEDTAASNRMDVSEGAQYVPGLASKSPSETGSYSSRESSSPGGPMTMFSAPVGGAPAPAAG